MATPPTADLGASSRLGLCWIVKAPPAGFLGATSRLGLRWTVEAPPAGNLGDTSRLGLCWIVDFHAHHLGGGWRLHGCRITKSGNPLGGSGWAPCGSIDIL
mmetsp:Transcript_41466/g.121288  ORF Transcript_41466/g.121288 Transcript_41466/m.121288 type:complete len:101 (-) Transcript_41466:18-320(-)